MILKQSMRGTSLFGLSTCKSQKYATSYKAKGSEINGDMQKKLEPLLLLSTLKRQLSKSCQHTSDWVTLIKTYTFPYFTMIHNSKSIKALKKVSSGLMACDPLSLETDSNIA